MATTIIYGDLRKALQAAKPDRDRLWLNREELEEATGWEIKPEGICRAEICIPLQGSASQGLLERSGEQVRLDLAGFARFIGQPYARDSRFDVWSFGPRPQERRSNLQSLLAPDFNLPDLDGEVHSLSDQKGKKVLLVLWASWCRCRFDLPLWQALSEELKGQNFEIVTVACDTKGSETAKEWIEAAKPGHPSLIDSHFLVAELYNTRNVPATFWIDEFGQIVRANDPIYVARRDLQTGQTTINEEYLDAVRDWVQKGSASIYVTKPEETKTHIGDPDEADCEAMAYFRLGLYLHDQGHATEAIEHFKHAHELKPNNWNYKRQAWSLGDIEKDYGTTIREAMTGPIPFYPPLDLPEPT